MFSFKPSPLLPSEPAIIGWRTPLISFVAIFLFAFVAEFTDPGIIGLGLAIGLTALFIVAYAARPKL